MDTVTGHQNEFKTLIIVVIFDAPNAELTLFILFPV